MYLEVKNMNVYENAKAVYASFGIDTEEAIKKAAILGEKIAKVTIKDTSSRWGSCSSRKNLNFCWRLILAPSYVAEYIFAS